MKKKNIVEIAIGSFLVVGAGISIFKLLKKQNNEKISNSDNIEDIKEDINNTERTYIKLPYHYESNKSKKI